MMWCVQIFLYVVNKQINYIRSGPEHINHSMLLKTNYIPNSSAIYNVKKLGKFIKKPVGHEDYLMWLKFQMFPKNLQNKNAASYILSSQFTDIKKQINGC